MVAGLQRRVVWQLSQEALVVMCPGSLPVALLPLWQVAHWPGTALSWLKLAGVQALVLWQLSQEAEVATWPAFLPLALLPLWQVAQVPAATVV
jgi:hypothetical protein